jgi:16S rRNA processing protein RimM
MEKKDCFNIGYIARSVGTAGQVQLQMDVDNPNRYAKLESLFLSIDNNLVPFFITFIKINGNKANIQFDGIDSTQKAAEITSTEAFLPLSMLPPLEGKEFYLHEVIGFEIHDKTKGNIGTLVQVLSMPQQKVFEIKHPKAEILIPAIPEFIVKIDRENKTIYLDSPEGLIDIYLPQE